MKLTIVNNLIVAHAETPHDNIELTKLHAGLLAEDRVSPMVFEHRPASERGSRGPYHKVKKHKKHQFIKRCDVPGCDRDFKGAIGLASHQAKIHGIRGVHSQAYDRHQAVVSSQASNQPSHIG